MGKRENKEGKDRKDIWKSIRDKEMKMKRKMGPGNPQ